LRVCLAGPPAKQPRSHSAAQHPADRAEFPRRRALDR
jgi:hypothetical protein